MEVKELVGNHMLDAVDFSEDSIKDWADDYQACSVCRFRLDGVVYMAIEDPDDGYRSSMREMVIDNDAKMNNVFTPQEVVGRHRTEGSYSDKDDVLELIDTSTGKTVLEVGTADVDDYYPCFVAAFHPEAMSCNQKQ